MIPFSNVQSGEFDNSSSTSSSIWKTLTGRSRRRSEVHLTVYDLSNRLAPCLSTLLFCKKIPYFPHTGIIVYGREYFWGENIKSMKHQDFVKETKQKPTAIIHLGYTEIDPDTFHQYLSSRKHLYTKDTYSLLDHNCNAFTEDCSRFLVGRGIPEHITNAPLIVKNSCTGSCFLTCFAVPAIVKRVTLLLFVLLLSMAGFVMVLAMDSKSCDVVNSNTNFAAFAFFFDALITFWLLACLLKARYRRQHLCCHPSALFEIILQFLIVFFDYTAAVSLSSVHVAVTCKYGDRNFDLLSIQCAFAWILCSLWPVRLIFLRAVPLMSTYIVDKDGDGSSSNNGGGNYTRADDVESKSDETEIRVPLNNNGRSGIDGDSILLSVESE